MLMSFSGKKINKHWEKGYRFSNRCKNEKVSKKNKTENFLFLKPLGLWNSIKVHLNILTEKKRDGTLRRMKEKPIDNQWFEFNMEHSHISKARSCS